MSKAKIAAEPRKMKRPEYKSFKLSKRISHPIHLPNAFKLFRNCIRLIGKEKLLFAKILAVYAIASILLVQGFGGSNLDELKEQLTALFTGNIGQITSSAIIFVSLVSSAGNTSEVGAAYQVFLTLIVSLAIIWALRQVSGGVKVNMRTVYYNSMYPLIPVLTVLFFISLQLIPIIVGTSIYSIIVTNEIAVYPAEKILWALLCGLFILLSAYMVSSSLFALYIATLPDMTPLKALRSARELVRFRRWTVLRKVLFLPFMLLLLSSIIMLPIILFATVAAEWFFFILTTIGLAVTHSYFYTLYRELLNE